jgi:hypothetical protein
MTTVNGQLSSQERRDEAMHWQARRFWWIASPVLVMTLWG